ncbi:SDR family oxidoreductase [Mucilaginibacter sp.]|uniref:SDR family oxidoreductase n=1 Tax=Mucilaginibacter sp. TaxID=1882438 RepID=UPI002845FD61|nr:SDR family oxidoreductase [Mucilaginibacter sp.]MDR3693907.1 SDR family oxidoreductase [Mucilaginibacter sp.]
MKDKETPANKNLHGKRVVLLGGTSGFGLATALAAAAEGAEIIVVSSRQQRVDEALALLPAGSNGYAVDLNDEQQIAALFNKVSEFDHLIFTAGETLQLNEFSAIKIDEAKQFFNIRYWGALMAARYGSSHIRKGGSITLTNGTIGLRPWKGWAVAASLTCAIEGLTRALAVELAPIRVNAVCAGMARTELWSNIAEAEREAMFMDYGSKLLTGSVGEATDIAEAYLYLMKGGFSTGQVIVVDGGGVLV